MRRQRVELDLSQTDLAWHWVQTIKMMSWMTRFHLSTREMMLRWEQCMVKMVRTEQMEKTVHNMQLKRAHLQMLVLQPVPLPKPCLVRDQAVEDLLHHWVQNSREIPSGRGHII